MPTKIVAFTTKTAKDILAVREQVFTLEQGVAAELDIDGEDGNAKHCVIYSEQNIIATGRLLNNGHIGRVAVLSPYRGQGIGSQVMQALETEAQQRGDKSLFLHAQLSALAFYKKRGYQSQGEVFLNAGIQHICMVKTLS